MRGWKFRSREDGAGQIGAVQVAASEIRVGKICTRKTSAPQLGAIEIGVVRFDFIQPRGNETRIRDQQRSEASLAKIRVIEPRAG